MGVAVVAVVVAVAVAVVAAVAEEEAVEAVAAGNHPNQKPPPTGRCCPIQHCLWPVMV